MKLFLLRHGAAGQRNMRKYPNDAARPLTGEGKRETLRTAHSLRRQEFDFDEIISSPLTRARQTAEIVAKVYRKEVKLTPYLGPGVKLRDVIHYLARACAKASSVMLVGHEPDMSSMISVLISGHEGANIRLKKGGLCKLDVESLRFGKCAELDWLLTPRQLTR